MAGSFQRQVVALNAAMTTFERVVLRKKPSLPSNDIDFARTWVAKTAAEHEHESHEEAAARVDETEHQDLTAPSGARLYGEVEWMWDEKPGEAVRIWVSVWWLDDPRFTRSPLALELRLVE